MQTSDGATVERKLQASADALAEAVATSSDDVSRKAPPGRWSVLECVEHIALVQDGFSGRIVASPMGAEMAADSEREGALFRMVQSRETVVSTPQVAAPRKSFSTIADAMVNYHRTDTLVRKRLEQVELNLRSLQVQHPALGLINGYEAFLLIGAHTMRHVAQIQELVNSEGVTFAK